MGLYSFNFFVFTVIVFTLYWSLFRSSANSQNILLTGASIFFCGLIDIRFLSILLFSTVFNFYTGIAISKRRSGGQKLLLYLGVSVNVALLLYYKYFNFFYEGFIELLGFFEPGTTYSTLSIILPIGISFFTFQAIGYLIDIYREEIESCKSLLSFSTFISYFPKMTAGPIERPGKFLPQINDRRLFSYDLCVDGLRQILWGSFIKLVIANNCISITKPIFDNYSTLPASSLYIGAFFYVFQIYCDFAGYSNVAIGISKLFGIRLMRNFSAPFFSTNIREYWKKWHISLSSWMMDYVFTPLSFSLRKFGKYGLIFSILVTFTIIGIWHGANWTFIIFGLMHGLYFVPLIVIPRWSRNSNQKEKNSKDISLRAAFKMVALFFLIMYTIIIFGSVNLSMAFGYLSRMMSFSVFSMPIISGRLELVRMLVSLLFIIIMLVVEWLQRQEEHEMRIDRIRSRAMRLCIYYFICMLILVFGSVSKIGFLYSQF